MQVVAFAEIDQIQDILFEAGAAETDARPQELASDTGIHADCARNLLNIRLGFFAKRRNAVDRGDSLCQHRVGNEFGHFTAPDIRRKNLLTRHPVCVDIDQALHGFMSVGRRHGTDQDAVRIFQVSHCRSFRKKLRIGKNGEVQSFRIRLQNPVNRLCRTYRQSAFLHDNLVFRGTLHDQARGFLPELKVGGFACAGTECLGRGVDADENDFRLTDSFFHICREKEIPPSGLRHKLFKPRLINRQTV